MPPVESVLRDMRSLGFQGTELGAPGFLPDEPDRLRALLDLHGLRLVGSFVALPLLDATPEWARSLVAPACGLLAALGADVLIGALVQDMDWSPPRRPSAAQWRTLDMSLKAVAAACEERNLRFAVHPHWGSVLERAEEIELALERLDVDWCLDTGHLLIAGLDPAGFAERCGERIAHVHLKDVDAGVALRLREGELSLLAAVRAGLFRPLGRGDANIEAVLDALDVAGYDGWLVIEQDSAPDVQDADGRIVDDIRESIEFLRESRTTKEEVKP